MPAQANQAFPLKSSTGEHEAEAEKEPAPSATPPPHDEVEFAELVNELVSDEAPRLFAVVQVLGDNVDGRIAAWGMAFEGHTEVLGVDGRTRLRLGSPERALHGFHHRATGTTARLVWLTPLTTGPATQEERHGASAGTVERAPGAHDGRDPIGTRRARAADLHR